MKISSLRLKNFRCYCGQQDPLDLSTSPAANIVLIFGENMKGKTSLLQAIRWCLYGTAKDRQGREIPLIDPETKEQLLSRDAESDGDYTLAVEMQFQHEGKDYVLRREVVAEVAPTTDAGFRVIKELRTGARVYPESSIDPWVQNMLSEDVSRFFLFDAEMLEEYEDLLKDPEQEAQAVKVAIEKILGLPALRSFAALQELATASEQRQNAHLRKREKHAVLLEEVGKLENAIRGKTSDIAELERTRDKLRLDVNEAELAVRQNADIAAKIREMGILDSQTEDEQDRLKTAQESIAAVLQSTWWLPMVPYVQQRLANLGSERVAAMETIQSLCRLQELEKSKAEKKCSLCETALAHSTLERVEDEINQLRLEHYGHDLSALLETARRAETYEQFNSQQEMVQVRMLHDTVVNSQISISELETRVEEIRAGMVNRAYGDYDQKYERWQRLSDELRKLEQLIDQLREELQGMIEERGSRQAQLNKLPDADPTLLLETSAYRLLADIFREAVDIFRDRLRESVGADASEIFKRLTTEKAYQGLRIDENYGLTLLDSCGNPVPGRSAGAEQVVALSLIGGLNAAAVREAPVVMDSNFARLDRGHRRNVLQFLPQLGPQVIVLVHSGEIDKESDLEEAGVRVARRYEIARITETRSRIVPETI